MKTTVEPLEGNKVKLSVEVDESEFNHAVDAAFKRIAREVRIPGFRPGKAPRKLLEARLGPGVAREEALREALPEYYAQALRERDIDAIAAPEIDITSGQDDGAVVFDAVVEVRPQVLVAGYGSLRVTIPSPTVGDEEIDAHIDRLREQFGELEVVDRPARDGDHVSIDIKGSQGGEEVEGLTADDYLYELGSGSVVPELDEQLRGKKIGDIVEFSADHPDPDEEPLDFRVLVKDVKEKVLPEVTDEWANEASEFETVEELRADISRRMGAMKRVQAQMALREKVAEVLAELVDDDAPEPLVQQEMQTRLQDLAMRLQAQGLNLEQYFAASGKEQAEIAEELRETAAQAVKVDLALRSVADAEGIEVDDDDLDEEWARVAQRVGEKPEEIRRRFERAEQVPAVRSDLRKRKALDWLVDNVEIVDEGGETIDRSDLELPSEPTDQEEGEAAASPVAETAEEDSETAE
ncbi:MAG: trigger factor [Actinomycetota bacterium]